MKNKQSKTKSVYSKKSSSILIEKNNKQQKQMQLQKQEDDISSEFVRPLSKGPTISQINRLKRFYNTTRWLPNSSFTTFFGKPAFENYGYGNTNPTYGGLFYGNYMLSHNINPVDGDNIPPEKQVYASSMLKASRSIKSRKPEPPRKVPDEIRNTPDELKEIRGRNPIFQKDNNFPNREILKPNLIRAKYFRSPKGTPKKEQDTNYKGVALNEEFDIEGLLDGRGEFKKKKKNVNLKANSQFYSKELKKKPIKEKVDNTNSEYLKALKEMKENKSSKNNQLENRNEHEECISDENTNKQNDNIDDKISYSNYDGGKDHIMNNEQKDNNLAGNNNSQSIPVKNKMKEFYEKMLEEKLDNNNKGMNESKIYNNQNSTLINAQQTTHAPEDNNNITQYNRDYQYQGESFRTRMMKKENPCLIPNRDLKCAFFKCTEHPIAYMNVEEMDPRNLKQFPTCYMNKIPFAGKPLSKETPLNLFG